MTVDMSPLEQLLISEAPSIIAFTQGLFKKANPDLPIPTSEEIQAAYQNSFLADVAKDEQWKKDNPNPNPPSGS